MNTETAKPNKYTENAKEISFILAPLLNVIPF
jgi:hypothetical protein